MKIKDIEAMEILDSRGNPTVSATVILENGVEGTAAVPSGASTGTYEAHELWDNDKKRFGGKGVLQAVKNVETEIKNALAGLDAAGQAELDKKMTELDGTPNKSRLGANAILAVSLAAARAEAKAEGKPLYEYLTKFNPKHNGTYVMPVPMLNIMNGGKHANWATDIQEYMIMPVGAKTMADAVRMGAEVYQNLKSTLLSKNYSVSVGDEGGFAPVVGSNAEPFGLMTEAIEQAGYKSGKDIIFAVDAAATEFYRDNCYKLNMEGKELNSGQLADFYLELAEQYPIKSMEDIFAEDDWEGFQRFTGKMGAKTQIVGDDLYVTNIERLKKGIENKATNSILIKVNQIGTLSETIDAILMAGENGFTSVVSHRSGETEDDFIADLVVAMGTGQIKTGAPARSERTVKYNRLMKIEKELGAKAAYAKFPF